uniref:Chaperone DnaJ C-terminal domain-containing protein n=1 Tax=Falco tinnunculus TaxID=100819 RepID=A0A8C4U166_FALTI
VGQGDRQWEWAGWMPRRFGNRPVGLTCAFLPFPGLKGGAPTSGPGGSNGPTFTYTFRGDPHAMFAEFFDGRNPFDTFFVQRNGDDDDGDDTFTAFHVGGFGSVGFPRGRGGPEGACRKQDPPVLYDLKVSLEEIYSGCTKKMKISHKRLNPDGKTVRNEDKILTIEVKRGWKEGTKITFPKEGDQTPNNIPADVVFVLKDKPHGVFRREGSDIVYPAKISLREVGGGSWWVGVRSGCLSGGDAGGGGSGGWRPRVVGQLVGGRDVMGQLVLVVEKRQVTGRSSWW